MNTNLNKYTLLHKYTLL